MFRFKYFIVFLCGSFLLNCFAVSTGFSQADFHKISETELYSSELDIVNGTKWYYHNKFKGHPFWSEGDFLTGTVDFAGESFSGLLLNYELVGNELILTKKVDGQSKTFKLNEKFVDGFTLKQTDSDEHYVFRKINLPGVSGVRYYHSVYQGKTTSCYIYHKKTISNRVYGDYMGKYMYHPIIYVRVGENYEEVKNKRSLLQLLENHKNELKKYIRRNRLSIDAKQPEEIAHVLKYYDSLN